jgi:hypothetical protein
MNCKMNIQVPKYVIKLELTFTERDNLKSQINMGIAVLLHGIVAVLVNSE